MRIAAAGVLAEPNSRAVSRVKSSAPMLPTHFCLPFYTCPETYALKLVIIFL